MKKAAIFVIIASPLLLTWGCSKKGLPASRLSNLEDKKSSDLRESALMFRSLLGAENVDAFSSNYLNPPRPEQTYKLPRGNLQAVRLVDSSGNEIAVRNPSLSPYACFPECYEMTFSAQTLQDPSATIRDEYVVISPDGQSGGVAEVLGHSLDKVQKDLWPYRIEQDKARRRAVTRYLPISPKTNMEHWYSSQEFKLMPIHPGATAKAGIKFQKRSVKLASLAKGGDEVTFQVLLGCGPQGPLMQHKPLVGGGTMIPDEVIFQGRPAKASMRVRLIQDGAVEIDGVGGKIRTKEARGFVSKDVAGNDPQCVEGRTVFDAQGRLYGLVTKYTPDDRPEVDNVVIATIHDERVSRLLELFYQEVGLEFLTEETYRPFTRWIDKTDGSLQWRMTDFVDRFDPRFIDALTDESTLASYAIQRTPLDCSVCATREKLLAACDAEESKLRLLRDNYLKTQRRARVISTQACALPRMQYRLQGRCGTMAPGRPFVQ